MEILRSRLKRRLNLTESEQDALLDDLLEDAAAFVLGYTGRKALPTALEGAVVELAAGSWNLLGLEGASAHSEGGVSATIELLSPRMRSQMDMYRLARVL